MPDAKVSALPAATTPLVGDELVPVVQGAISERATVNDIRGLSDEYTTTQPTSPAAGVKLFSRYRARRLLAQVGPNGVDTVFQPSLFSNRVARMNAVNNSGTPTFDGLAITSIQAPAPVQNATTNFYTSMVRARWAATTTAGTAGGFRSSSAQWFLSSTANLGGFFFVCRFGLGVTSTTNRLFIGMSSTTTALSPTTEPTAFTNMIGFGCSSTQTTFRVLHNAAATATQVDLGANYPTQTAATNFFEFRLFAPSGNASTVYWSATRLNDGAFTQGTITTNIPAAGTILSAHVHHGNGSAATATNIEVQSLYVETDN